MMSSLILLAKGAPVAPAPPSDEVLVYLGLFLGAVVLWSAISAVLSRWSVLLFNRFAAPEHQTVDLAWLKALLIGCLHVGAVIVVNSVTAVVVNVVVTLVMFAFGGRPHDSLLVVYFALVLIGQLFASWVSKTLLSMAFLPCRFYSGLGIGGIWAVLELLLIGLLVGGTWLGLYATDRFDVIDWLPWLPAQE